MKDNVSTGSPPTIHGIKVRDLVLAMLLLQTTAVVLLMRYSATRVVPGVPGYKSTVAVFFAELLKLPFCVCMAGRAVGGIEALKQVLNDEVFGNVRDTLKCAIPAVAFTVQGNLLFVALANLDAPTYQVVYQSKTVFTALASRMLLGRRLKESQWVALVLLCVGGVLVSDLSGAQKNRSSSSGQVNIAVGVAAVLSAAGLSASSSVYFEMMLKKPVAASPTASAASLWLRNIQLGLFATPLAALAISMNDGEFVAERGLLHGFDHVVWIIVGLNGLGGLLVAATMKYADNIVKCFAAGLAILAGTLLSVPIFGFELHGTFLLGVACTISASTVYAWAPERPAACREGGRKPRHSAENMDLELDTLEDEEQQQLIQETPPHSQQQQHR